MTFRRLMYRYKLNVFLLSSFLFICFIFILSRYDIKHRRFFSKNGFDIHDINNELDRYHNLKNEYKLTGIILHWQRLNGVQQLVQTMLKYDDLFSYIIIWNNNPNKNLTFEDLLIEENVRTEIINSDVNIKDQAKYLACQFAKTNACFYVDDDWDIKMYMRSLYSHFLLEPTLLHAITDQFTYFTNLMWTFFDETIHLHTGFSWIGCGSIYTRENAIRHLRYLKIFLDNDNYRDMIPQADQFFSIWMNQIPAQFNGRLLHSDEGASSSFDNFDFETIQYKASVLSIRKLEKSLRFSSKSTVFNRERASNTLVTYTKSPCSYNDRFIFFTNCLPIDNLEQISFNITTDIKRGTRGNLPNMPDSKYKNDVEFFENFNTANAVDNDTSTCWKIHRYIRKGDLYGIDFQTIQINSNLSFTIQYSHEKYIQKQLEISISLDSYTWIPLPRPYRSGITYKKRRKLITFRTNLFPQGFQVFRFIRFTSLIDQTSYFHICEIRLIDQ